MFLGVLGLTSPDEVPHAVPGRVEPSLARGDGSFGETSAPVRRVVVELGVNVLDELVEALDLPAPDPYAGVVVGVVLGFVVEEHLDARDHVGDLAALALGLGEHELEVALAYELAHGPVVGLNTFLATARVGDRLAPGARADRSPQTDRLEGTRRQ